MLCSDHRVSLYLYLKIKPFVHQDEEKKMCHFSYFIQYLVKTLK